MEHLNQLFETTIGRIETVAKSDMVMGDPIVMGDVTLIPLSRMSVGFGAGGGQGEGEQPHKRSQRTHRGKGTGGGAGMGSKLRPTAVIVIGPDGVDIRPVPPKKGLLDRIFDRLPEVAELAQGAPGGSKHCGC